MGDREGADLLEEAVIECINDRSVDKFSFFVSLDDCKTCYGEFEPHQLHSVCNQIQDLVRRSYRTCWDCECEVTDSCDCGSESLSVDLHTNNILYRKDGTLVINDPVCDANMEDVDDLSNWADDHELVA